jgi:hypothetical protein
MPNGESRQLTAWAALASVPLWLGLLFSDHMVYIVAYLVGSPLIGKLNDGLGVATDPGQMRLALLLWLGSRAREAGAEG